MDIQTINELFDRFENSSLEEFSLDFEGASLSMKKTVGKGSTVDREIEILPQDDQEDKKLSGKKLSEKELSEVKAPLAGTFYQAPSPEDPPFVKPGQQVKKGDVIGIIEAMKLMNEVTMAEDGVIEEILVDDGSLVAYDEVLIRYV